MSRIVQTEPPATSPLGQAYLRLADALFSRLTDTVTLAVVAIKPGSGATTTARNLAIASARYAGCHTLLVTGQNVFGDDDQPRISLHEVAESDVEWIDALHDTPIANLTIATYGENFPQWDFARGEAFQNMLQLQFDRVILDVPGISHYFDQPAWICRDVVCVVQPGTLNGEEAATSRQRMQAVGIEPLAIILNKSTGAGSP